MTAVGLEAETRTTSGRRPAERPLHGLRVAVVHYWLTGYGGGVKALEQLAEIFPQADFYALVATP